MNKLQKIAASAALVEGIAAELAVEKADPAVIAATKEPKAKGGKKGGTKAPSQPAATKPAAPVAVVKAPKAPKEQNILSAKEVAVMKVIQGSDFADQTTKAVPSYVIALEVQGVEPKSVPGIVASLNKKGMLVGSKVKGLYTVALTAFGLDAYAAEVKA